MLQSSQSTVRVAHVLEPHRVADVPRFEHERACKVRDSHAPEAHSRGFAMSHEPRNALFSALNLKLGTKWIEAGHACHQFVRCHALAAAFRALVLVNLWNARCHGLTAAGHDGKRRRKEAVKRQGVFELTEMEGS